MLKINKQSITLTKGDDASLRLVPRYKDKTIYTVQEGDSAIFRLKVGASVKELECVINLENNKIVVNFTPADTKDFGPGIYRYEAELITSLGFHYTFIADQPFILGNEIEQRLSNATSANGNSNGNYPEIDGEIGDEPVVNGDIQPTNPMLDYDELNHLPKLNGKTIKGDKDNEYYGIPTKTSDLDNDSDFVSDDEYVHTDNNYDDTNKGKVDALGTASTYDVAESGNASTSQVVKGDDTRLMDARTPVAHQHSKVDITDFPTNVSAFNNDSGYITNAVNTLINYYLKSETYTKTEVEQLIAAIKQGKFEVVETLPANPDPNVIYLVPKDPTQTSNAYDEYVYINNAWEKIGDTDIDLSDYVTDEELTTALQNYVTTSAFQTAIANYYTKTETDNLLSNKVDKVSGKGLSTNDYDNTAKGIVDGVTTALAGKVDKVNGKGLSTEDYTTAEKTKLAAISDEANKVTSSSTNGHINIDGVDTTVYDDTAVTTAISGLNENVEDIQDELSVDTATVEGNPINFSTKSAQNAESTIIDLEPIQDLHGYDKPWTGGAGKNKLPLTGTTQTINGETFTVNSNGTITTSNTPSAAVRYDICAEGFTLKAGTYLLKGMPVNSESGTRIALRTNISEYSTEIAICTSPSGSTFTLNADTTVYAVFISTPTGNHNITISPMIISSSEPDTSFAPWKNECPITGRTEIGILGCGKNLLKLSDDTQETAQSQNIGIVYSNSGATFTANGTFARAGYSYKTEIGKQYTLGLKGSSDANYRQIYLNNMIGFSTHYQGIELTSTETKYTRTFTADSEILFVGFYVTSNSNSGSMIISEIQLEENSQDTPYEPYQESTDLTISLGQTVYGCHYSVENGELEVWNVSETFDGSVDEGIAYGDTRNVDYGRIYAGISSDSMIWTESQLTSHKIWSDKYTEITNSNSFDATMAGIHYRANGSHQVVIFPKETGITDEASARTWLSNNPIQICYTLATPRVINLTPNEISLLEGVNNISTDGDKITLTYRDGKVATLGDLKEAVDEMSAKSHTYSTSEQVVGTWIDGKPIYEKTVNMGSFSTGYGQYPHNISNIDNIIYYQFIGKRSDSSGGWFDANSVGSDILVTVNKSDVYRHSNSISCEASYLVIQYTKTTDV